MKVRLTKRAAKELRRLPSKYQDKIKEKIRVLEKDNLSPLLDIKPFFGFKDDSFRLRVGQTRAIFYYEGDGIIIYAIGFRGGVYK